MTSREAGITRRAPDAIRRPLEAEREAKWDS